MSDSDFDGLVLDSDDYGDKINHIEIPHERTRQRNGALTEEEQEILRSELGKLKWVARIARPDSIYDDSADAQTFPECKITEEYEANEEIAKIEEDELTKANHFELMPGFTKFLQGKQMEVNKVNLLKKIRNLDRPKPILR